MCSGMQASNFVSAIFKLSNIGLVISITEEYSCVFLMHKTEFCIPLYVLIFDKNREIVFPSKETVHPNTQNIVSHSHLNNIYEIFDKPKGTTVFVYPQSLQLIDSDIFFQQQSLVNLLKKVKDIRYVLLGNLINYEEINKTLINNDKDYSCRKTESKHFSILIYFYKKIVYWECKNQENFKISQNDCLEVRIKDKKMLSQATGLLEWNLRTTQLFSDLLPLLSQNYSEA